MSKPAEHVIRIHEGKLVFVWDDALVDLVDEGQANVLRASFVEPAAKGGWEATMVGGPVLGPFRTRAEALDAERQYLREERGL